MSADADAITDALNSAAAGPKSVAGDAGRVESQPLPDLIQADRYVRSKDAASKPARGLRITKLTPPGTV